MGIAMATMTDPIAVIVIFVLEANAWITRLIIPVGSGDVPLPTQIVFADIWTEIIPSVCTTDTPDKVAIAWATCVVTAVV
mmetsp:Transcript_14698/g.22406  ORF Transcript_14698/g.22406 Transcript_14698/m.22406 type:complete len:80 (-) Transcript_14698:251-490(-)